MSQNTFSMAGGVARNPLVRLAKPVTATIGADEHIAIVGPNGSGKSLFVDTLIGKYPLREGALQYDFSPSATQTVYDNVKYIAFRDTYGAADANYYYQQRWNAHDQDEAPDVREMLGEIKDEQLKNELFDLFRIEPLLDKKIILLSSGELRKFQLTKTLLTAPRVLIMDNPFIGLDAPTRELLFSLLDRLTKMSSVQKFWCFPCWMIFLPSLPMSFPLTKWKSFRKWNVKSIWMLSVQEIRSFLLTIYNNVLLICLTTATITMPTRW